MESRTFAEACEAAAPGKADKEWRRFCRGWAGYVSELTGCSPEELRRGYLSERAWLLGKLEQEGVLEVWRTVVLPEGSDVEALPGTDACLGRFWTLSRGVAEGWRPSCVYDEAFVVPEDGVRVLLRGRIEADDVDLVETVACRLGSDWEDEIRVKQGRRATVLEARVLDAAPAMAP